MGSGDAQGPYRLARTDPERLFVATDLNAEALRDAAWRAGRRASRGGVPNLLCIAAAPEELARELPGVADRLTVLLPWGELLHAAAASQPLLLEAIAALCQTEATVELVFSHDSGRDTRTLALPACYDGDADSVRAHLQPHYERVGLCGLRVELLDERALLTYPTTWAKRLAHGRGRRVWRLRTSRARND